MVARDRWQLWASRTHDGGAEWVEGVGPAGVEVGAVQPLQEPHVVEALGLQGGAQALQAGRSGGSPSPAPTQRLYLVVPALLQAVHLLLRGGFPVDLQGEERLLLRDPHRRMVPLSLQGPAFIRAI